MSILTAILVTGLGTYFSRAVFILAFANRRLPPTLVRALEYVAPSVLGALVMTLLLGPDGTTKVGTAELVALLVAALVAPGGIVVANHELAVPAWTRLPEPEGVKPGRYFLYRAG